MKYLVSSILLLSVFSGCSLVGDCGSSSCKSEGKCSKCGKSECTCDSGEKCEHCSGKEAHKGDGKKSCH